MAEPSPETAGAERRRGRGEGEDAPVTVTLTPDLPSSATEVPKAPWHFKLLVVATVVYLGWRLVQLVGVAF